MCKKCYKKLPTETKKANKRKLKAEQKMDDKERKRLAKEGKGGAEEDLSKEEEWKRKAAETAKARKKAKIEEYKERKKK